MAISTSGIKLSDAINSPQLNLQDLGKILDKSQASVSFWGTRIVTVEGYEGSVRLLDISRRMMNFVNDTKTDFSEEERASAIKSIGYIRTHYNETDQMQKSNPITAIFAFFQSIFGTNGENLLPYNERWFIEDHGAIYRFKGYTESQFRARFPEQPLPREYYSRGNDATFYFPHGAMYY